MLYNLSPVFLSRKIKKKNNCKKRNSNLDYMIIIHNHYEYLQRKTVMSIKKRYFIVQLVLKFRKFGIKKERITELDEMKNMR